MSFSPLLCIVTLLLFPAGESRARNRPPAGPCPPPEDGLPYLLTSPAGGLNNQRWSVMIGLLYAQQRNLTYIVPPAVRLQLKPPYCDGFDEERPFSFLYDTAHLHRFGASRGIRVISNWNATQQRNCCGAGHFNRFRPAPQDPRLGWCFDGLNTFERIRGHLNALIPFRFFGPSLPLHFFYIANPQFAGMREALVPAPPIQAALDAMNAQFARLIGDAPYGVVHARLEKDFNPKELVEAEITRRMLSSGTLPRNSKLHVCTGFELSRLPILCSAYRCFKVTQVPLPREVFGHCSAEALPRDLIAFFDFHIALRASVFFGNFRSSFSIELYYEFLRWGKPAFFLNWNGTHEY